MKFFKSADEVPMDCPISDIANDAVKAEIILRRICSLMNVERNQIKKRNRKVNVVRVRDWCCFFMCFETNLSLVGISNLFYKKFDHTCVIYSRNKIAEKLAEGYMGYKTEYESIINALEAKQFQQEAA